MRTSVIFARVIAQLRLFRLLKNCKQIVRGGTKSEIIADRWFVQTTFSHISGGEEVDEVLEEAETRRSRQIRCKDGLLRAVVPDLGQLTLVLVYKIELFLVDVAREACDVAGRALDYLLGFRSVEVCLIDDVIGRVEHPPAHQRVEEEFVGGVDSDRRDLTMLVDWNQM